MYRYGYTPTHKQRWRCYKCRITRIQRRPDVVYKSRYKLFTKWLLSPISLQELAKQQKVTRQTLHLWFQPFWQQHTALVINPKLRSQKLHPIKDNTLILDATYLKTKLVVLIAKDKQRVIGFYTTQRENYDSWVRLLEKVKHHVDISSSIKTVVIDGQKGLMQAVNEVFKNQVKVQRCLFHIHLLSRVYLTSRPKTIAGIQLKLLVNQLSQVETKQQMHIWLSKFFLWFVYHAWFLQEKTLHPYKKTKTGKPIWYYKHKKLRSAFNLVKNALPYLFTFLTYLSTPRTTNHVEGGVNARLKELIHRHRGLTFEKQKILISLFLQSKM